MNISFILPPDETGFSRNKHVNWPDVPRVGDRLEITGYILRVSCVIWQYDGSVYLETEPWESE